MHESPPALGALWVQGRMRRLVGEETRRLGAPEVGPARSESDPPPRRRPGHRCRPPPIGPSRSGPTRARRSCLVRERRRSRTRPGAPMRSGHRRASAVAPRPDRRRQRVEMPPGQPPDRQGARDRGPRLARPLAGAPLARNGSPVRSGRQPRRGSRSWTSDLRGVRARLGGGPSVAARREGRLTEPPTRPGGRAPGRRCEGVSHVEEPLSIASTPLGSLDPAGAGLGSLGAGYRPSLHGCGTRRP